MRNSAGMFWVFLVLLALIGCTEGRNAGDCVDGADNDGPIENSLQCAPCQHGVPNLKYRYNKMTISMLLCQGFQGVEANGPRFRGS